MISDQVNLWYVIDNTLTNEVWYHYHFLAMPRNDSDITTNIVMVLSVINHVKKYQLETATSNWYNLHVIYNR